jgi:anthranilate synthase component 1
MKIHVNAKKVLSDVVTPVGIYLKIRDVFPHSALLEGADYHGGKNAFSYICMKPLASFSVAEKIIRESYPDGEKISMPVEDKLSVPRRLEHFLGQFEISEPPKQVNINGLFGYTSYDAVQYFEDISFRHSPDENTLIPEMVYSFYKYIVAINHFTNTMYIIENLLDGEESGIEKIEALLQNRNFAIYQFHPEGKEVSNLSDQDYMDMVSKGKESCHRGDVFQIVLSRQFSQAFTGDEFNVYRALRSINPSPYLFYFDYGSYKIFGSSPESQLEIGRGVASINPIAGTFRRTGDDEKDRELAKKLAKDPKENAEHVMLVDLARNDLSRNASKVHVDFYREIHFYSHVLHMVSKVSGGLPEDANIIKVMADSFPAGTLSGAPKFKAMELIDKYENTNRGYYGGCIGNIGFDGSFNQAIMIRSFMSKNNTLYYQAGAGIVSESKEENELQEVNNKLEALKNAIIQAKNI